MKLSRPDRTPKILVLFSDTGGGHRSAAQAVIEVLEEKHSGEFALDMVDVFKAYAPYPLNQNAGPLSGDGEAPQPLAIGIPDARWPAADWDGYGFRLAVGSAGGEATRPGASRRFGAVRPPAV